MLAKLIAIKRILTIYKKNIQAYLKVKKSKEENAPKVFFELYDYRAQPYYFYLIFAFHTTGYQIYLKHNFLLIGNSSRALSSVFNFPNLKIALRYPKIKSGITYITDSDEVKGHNWEKIVDIDFNVYQSHSREINNITMPFHMSPENYISGRYKNVNILREVKKKMCIFFSGNQDRESYDHPIISAFFNKLSRVKVIDTVRDALSEKEVFFVENKDDWCHIQEYERKLVINYWKWSPIASLNLDSRIKNAQWLATLAQCDFFLATPGIRMPLCFNVIEAMSVGAIPIIEYPEYFDPPLEDMKNCLAFDGKSDLVKKVKDALKMDKEQVRMIRKGVVDYYEKYLKPECLVNLISTNSSQCLVLKVHATEISYQEYLKNRKES